VRFYISGCFGYPSAYTPRQEILVCQLYCGQLLPLGLLHPAGSRAQCGAPSLLCVVGATRLLLQVVPPAVELVLRPLLR
jgi:hypothetical protein